MRFNSVMGMSLRCKLVDVGASPINEPIYSGMLKAGDLDVVGFEPAEAALAELLQTKGPHETYLPHAIGDGGRHTLRICFAPGMTSLFEPNPEVLALFRNAEIWGTVTSTLEVDTVRLDDVPETADADMLALDIQGAELMALQNAEKLLSSALVVQSEVEFVEMYKGQPLFSEVEQFLRRHGFMFHTFNPAVKRLVIPLINESDPYAGLNQHAWADAVFVRDLTRMDLFSDEQLLKLAALMNDLYGSLDVALRALTFYDARNGTNLSSAYLDGLKRG